MKNNKGTIIIIVMAIVLLTGVIGYDIYVNTIDKEKPNITNITKTEKEVTITDEGIADAVEKLYDATVIVQLQSRGQTIGYGSGFVYKTDDKYGYIVTNYHVTDGYDEALIEYTNGTTTTGKVIGGDQYTDVSVVRVDKDTVLKVAETGKSADTRLGDTVFTIGTPISLNYKFTVTRGILSGKDRLASMSSSNNSFFQSGETWYLNELQIDATINSGNSGGPLANANGEVIGITNSKLSQSISNGALIENMSFAIPIEDVVNVSEQVISTGEVKRPYLGVTLTTVVGASRNGIDLDSSITSGAVVVSVEDGQSAEKAGLKAGDVITKVGDNEVSNFQYLKYYINRYKIGDKVTLTYIRGGKTHTTELELKSK